MKSRQLLLSLSSLAILALTSCNSVSYTHPRSSVNAVYSADINHDGVIRDSEDAKETNLTWQQSYDTLITEANKMKDLNAIADQLHIAEDEPKRCSLARYEILHEAEELLMSTGAVTPIYNYGDPYLLKPNIGGIYTINLGYKYMDKLYDRSDKSQKGLENVTMSVGTKAETFDPASNSDASTAIIMNQFLMGAKRYVQGEPEKEGGHIYKSELAEGVCTETKKIIKFEDYPTDEEKVNKDFFYAGDTADKVKVSLPDIYAELDSMEGKNDNDKFESLKAKYEGTARYTLTMNDKAVWNNGEKITADDFVYAWNRASSGTYNNMPFGMWCDMFNMIRGYEVWNNIGQQPTIDFETFDPKKSYDSSYEYKTNKFVSRIVKDNQNNWYKVEENYSANASKDISAAVEDGYLSPISENYKVSYKQVWEGISGNDASFTTDKRGCSGGMSGVLPNIKISDDGKYYVKEKDSNKSFTVQLINDCDYFESLLAFTAFMPVDKSVILKGEDEVGTICEEDPEWWLNKDNKYHTNGPLEINGVINNYEGGDGGVKLKASTQYFKNWDDKYENATKNLTFKFIDKDTTMLSEYRNGNIQLTNNFPNIAIDELRKTPDWQQAEQIGMFFYGFNVNDNTFDTHKEKDAAKDEREREALRNVIALLMNRYDLAVNVAKKGTPANGFVSDGVIETCQPVWNEQEGAYYAKRNGDSNSPLDGELVTANWHDRNGDTLEALRNAKNASNADERGDYIKKYAMDNRKTTMANDTSGKSGGFLKGDPERINVGGDKNLTEKEVQELNRNAAVELIKKYQDDLPGVSYDEKTGKFTKFPTIKISTNNGSALEELAERIQYFYNTWGIKITIQTQEWQSFTAARRNGDFAWAREGWVADFNDPRTYLDLCLSGNGNNDTQLGKDTWHRSK